jgi:hypothetical protein
MENKTNSAGTSRPLQRTRPFVKGPDMVRFHMKILRTSVLPLIAAFCIAAAPNWNPADAVKEAEQDIRTGHIKFYWSGSIASFPPGVPFEVAKKYPKADAGIGCVTNDIPLRERQQEYARRYNEKMFAYISQKH